MNRVALVIIAAMLLMTAGCSEEKETAESYADKLVSGEIQPQNDSYSENESNSPETKTEAAEETEDTNEAVSGSEDETDSDGVNIDVSDEQMAGLIDQAGEEYSSFDFQPIGSADFFLDKDLRVVAVVKDHQLTSRYAANIKTMFSNDRMMISYDTDGQTVSSEYYVYTISDEIKKTPNGHEYTYVVYGNEPITGSEVQGTIGILTKVKLPSDIQMGEAASDSYVFLIEASNPGVYELFKEE